MLLLPPTNASVSLLDHLGRPISSFPPPLFETPITTLDRKRASLVKARAVLAQMRAEGFVTRRPGVRKDPQKAQARKDVLAEARASALVAEAKAVEARKQARQASKAAREAVLLAENAVKNALRLNKTAEALRQRVRDLTAKRVRATKH
jgi:hypothetical protein